MSFRFGSSSHFLDALAYQDLSRVRQILEEQTYVLDDLVLVGSQIAFMRTDRREAVKLLSEYGWNWIKTRRYCVMSEDFEFVKWFLYDHLGCRYAQNSEIQLVCTWPWSTKYSKCVTPHDGSVIDPEELTSLLSTSMQVKCDTLVSHFLDQLRRPDAFALCRDHCDELYNWAFQTDYPDVILHVVSTVPADSSSKCYPHRARLDLAIKTKSRRVIAEIMDRTSPLGSLLAENRPFNIDYGSVLDACCSGSKEYVQWILNFTNETVSNLRETYRMSLAGNDDDSSVPANSLNTMLQRALCLPSLSCLHPRYQLLQFPDLKASSADTIHSINEYGFAPDTYEEILKELGEPSLQARFVPQTSPDHPTAPVQAYLRDLGFDVTSGRVFSHLLVQRGSSGDPDDYSTDAGIPFAFATAVDPDDPAIPYKYILYKMCVQFDDEAKRLELVKWLVEELGEDPNPDTKASTPLQLACMFNRKEIVRYLLAKGASPNPTVSSFGENQSFLSARHIASLVPFPSNTCLNHAIAVRDLELVKLLVEAKASTKASMASPNPLQVAASGPLDIIKYLMQNGAQVGFHVRDLLTEVIGSGQLEKLRYFVEECKVPLEGGALLLESAVTAGNVAMLRYLRSKGVSHPTLLEQDAATKGSSKGNALVRMFRNSGMASTTNFVTLAAESGGLRSLRWLIMEEGYKVPVDIIDKVMKSLAYNRVLESFMYMYYRRNRIHALKDKLVAALFEAMRLGHLDAVRFMVGEVGMNPVDPNQIDFNHAEENFKLVSSELKRYDDAYVTVRRRYEETHPNAVKMMISSTGKEDGETDGKDATTKQRRVTNAPGRFSRSFAKSTSSSTSTSAPVGAKKTLSEQIFQTLQEEGFSASSSFSWGGDADEDEDEDGDEGNSEDEDEDDDDDDDDEDGGEDEDDDEDEDEAENEDEQSQKADKRKNAADSTATTPFWSKFSTSSSEPAASAAATPSEKKSGFSSKFFAFGSGSSSSSSTSAAPAVAEEKDVVVKPVVEKKSGFSSKFSAFGSTLAEEKEDKPVTEKKSGFSSIFSAFSTSSSTPSVSSSSASGSSSSSTTAPAPMKDGPNGTAEKATNPLAEKPPTVALSSPTSMAVAGAAQVARELESEQDAQLSSSSSSSSAVIEAPAAPACTLADILSTIGDVDNLYRSDTDCHFEWRKYAKQGHMPLLVFNTFLPSLSIFHYLMSLPIVVQNINTRNVQGLSPILAFHMLPLYQSNISPSIHNKCRMSTLLLEAGADPLQVHEPTGMNCLMLCASRTEYESMSAWFIFQMIQRVSLSD